MATKKVSTTVATVEKIPPLNARSLGYNGLSVTSGIVFEECDPALRWPQCQYTYKKMLKDSTVGISVEAVQTDMSRPAWDIVAPDGYEEELKDKVAILKTMKDDMDHSFLSFIKLATSYVPYGFAVFEIVPKKRLFSKGSNYNDGYWGIGKLALRSQDTISGVEYTNDGKDFAGFWQRANIITNRGQLRTRTTTAGKVTNVDVFLPDDRILNFRNNPLKDNPFGSSPLATVFEAWKYKKAYEDAESHGVVADVHGLKVLYLPPQYMEPDASDDDKQVFAEYQRIMRNLHVGRESGIILPQILSADGKEGLFKFEVVSVTGSKAYDIDKIISRYKNEIITALYATSLVAGQEGGGSFALSESLIEIKDKLIESKLEEIRDVLNHKLIPLIFKWNGWETSVYPKFVFEKINPTAGMDIITKGLQRVGAVKLIARTAKNINAIAEMLNLPDRISEDMKGDALETLLGQPPDPTKAAQGQSSGLNGGSGKATGSSGDSSAGNSNNAA